MTPVLVALLLLACSHGVDPPLLVGSAADVTTRPPPSTVPINASDGSPLFLANLSAGANSLTLGLVSSWFDNCSTTVPNISTLLSGEGGLPPYLEFHLNITGVTLKNIPDIRGITVAQVGSPVAFVASGDSVSVYNAVPGLPFLGIACQRSGWAPSQVLFRASDQGLFVSSNTSFQFLADTANCSTGIVLDGYFPPARALALSWDETILFVAGPVLSFLDVTPSTYPTWGQFHTTPLDCLDVQVASPSGNIVVLSALGKVEVFALSPGNDYLIHLAHGIGWADRKNISSMAVGFVPGETQSKRRLYVVALSYLNIFEFDSGFTSAQLVAANVLSIGPSAMTVIAATLYILRHGEVRVVDVAAPSGAQVLGRVASFASFGFQILVSDGRAIVANSSAIQTMEVRNYFLQVNPAYDDPALTSLTVFGIDAFGGVVNTSFAVLLPGGSPCDATMRPTPQPTRVPTVPPTNSPVTKKPTTWSNLALPESQNKCENNCYLSTGLEAHRRSNASFRCWLQYIPRESQCGCNQAESCTRCGGDEDDDDPSVLVPCTDGGRCNCAGGAVQCLCSEDRTGCCFMYWSDVGSPPKSCRKQAVWPAWNCRTPLAITVVAGLPIVACVALYVCRGWMRRKAQRRIAAEAAAASPIPVASPVATPAASAVPGALEVVPPIDCAPMAVPSTGNSLEMACVPPPFDAPEDIHAPEAPPPAYETVT